MASGSELLTSLLFKISADSAELKQGLAKAQQDISSFGKGLGQLKGVIAGAFTVAAVIGFGKAVFDIADEIDGVIGKLDDLGQSADLALNAGKAKAIADVFGQDIDKVIGAANATANQFGITMNEALTYVQKGLALAGPESQKYLKSLESQAANYKQLGGNADSFFTIVTDGYRTSSNFEEQLKNGIVASAGAFDTLANGMNDGQLIQQKLVDSTAELNTEFANLFDGTGDVVDTFKIGFNTIAVGAIQAVKKVVVDVINYFIDLYNESTLFKVSIEAIKLAFTTLWEVVKLLFNQLVTGFKTVAKVIGAVLKGEFSSIPEILKTSFQESVNDSKTFANNIGNNIQQGVQNVLSKDKIKLLGEDADAEATVQGTKAAITFSGAFKKTYSEMMKGFSLTGNANDPLSTGVKMPELGAMKPVSIDVDTDPMDVAMEQARQNWEKYGSIVESVSSIAGQAIVSMTESAIKGSEDSGSAMENAGKQFVNAGKQFIAAALAQTLATAIMDSFKTAGNPIVGILLAGLATAGVIALFSAIPSFATGGQTNNPFFIAGESQGRGELVVNTGGGSRIYNHSQTKSMLDNVGGNNIVLTARISGESIYLTNQETIRRRANSR